MDEKCIEEKNKICERAKFYIVPRDNNIIGCGEEQEKKENNANSASMTNKTARIISVPKYRCKILMLIFLFHVNLLYISTTSPTDATGY